MKLSRHRYYHHSVKKAGLECPECGYWDFPKDRSRFRAHLKQHRPAPLLEDCVMALRQDLWIVTAQKCPDCPYQCRTPALLLRHRCEAHPTVEDLEAQTERLTLAVQQALSTPTPSPTPMEEPEPQESEDEEEREPLEARIERMTSSPEHRVPTPLLPGFAKLLGPLLPLSELVKVNQGPPCLPDCAAVVSLTIGEDGSLVDSSGERVREVTTKGGVAVHLV